MQGSWHKTFTSRNLMAVAFFKTTLLPLVLQARTTCGLLTASQPVPAASSDLFWPISPNSLVAGPTASPCTKSPSTQWTASRCQATAICPYLVRSMATRHATSTRRPTGRVRTERSRGVPHQSWGGGNIRKYRQYYKEGITGLIGVGHRYFRCCVTDSRSNSDRGSCFVLKQLKVVWSSLINDIHFVISCFCF